MRTLDWDGYLNWHPSVMVLWSVNLALEVGEDCVVGLAGDVALQAADGFSFGQSLSLPLR